ncbi:hypothetical protein SRABI106_03243 [Rahnella aquatilis]|nr:hypothetical protein SRABI106_03243 [Rahnella aquatilis]
MITHADLKLTLFGVAVHAETGQGHFFKLTPLIFRGQSDAVGAGVQLHGRQIFVDIDIDFTAREGQLAFIFLIRHRNDVSRRGTCAAVGNAGVNRDQRFAFGDIKQTFHRWRVLQL